MKLPRKGFLTSFLFLILIIGGFLYKSYVLFTSAGPLQTSTSIIINKGADLDDIARLLETENVVSSAAVFRLGVRAYGKSRKLKAGEFFIPKLSSSKNIMDIIVSGKTVVRSLTLPEGLTSARMVEIINNTPSLIGDDITDIPNEGELMPETYHYHYGVKKKEIFNRIKESMATYIDTVWDKRVSNLPFTTKEEALTLASIVERETSIPSEYPEVASVYINRLKIDMKLQADPTVIYAVSNGTAVLNRLLTLADLKIDNPYNTYVNKGLPPSPICNPGKKAIDAVLNPAETEYLFFVADGTGGHVFTKNYKDHSKKVSEWRKINKKYRASKKNSSKEPTINKNKKSTVKSNKKNVIIKDEKINKVEVKK